MEKIRYTAFFIVYGGVSCCFSRGGGACGGEGRGLSAFSCRCFVPDGAVNCNGIGTGPGAFRWLTERGKVDMINTVRKMRDRSKFRPLLRHFAGRDGMAKKRKRRRKSRGISVFLPVFLLTVSIGCVVLLVYWAVIGTQNHVAMASTKSWLEKVIGGENGETDFGREEISDRQETAKPENEAGLQAEGAAGQEAPPDSAEQMTEAAGMEAGGGGNEPSGEAVILQTLYDSGMFSPEDKIYVKETASPEEVSVVFAGDILFDDQYAVMAYLKQRGGAIESSISGDCLEIMRGADIFMVNNEFPYSSRGEPTPDKKFTFRGKPEYASYLLDMGVDIVSLANNHASDYGTVSLTDSIDVLNGIQMPFVGAGRNLEEAAKTAYFVANGMKIAVLSATQIERMENPATKGATDTSPGVFRCLNIDRLLVEIRKAKQVSDFVIVYVHWGTESTDEIDWAQKEQGPKIAEAGADLIIGDHPHVLQPVGYCGDVPVIYSLGNFLFNSKAQDTCLVRAVLDAGGLKTLQFIPGRQENCSVSMHYGAGKERVLSYMRGISPGVNIDADGFITKK